ncbi:hypothetical protein MLD38_013221 [Melastoma candidum]|uniref:Uncharacterized protein n=1 Tax=Melastoma candidum TaxID=119954 RepID=A0ACB9RA03_9MYRT|nr:hypothetical protein MLD38_013221 [Melastoma candidum]
MFEFNPLMKSQTIENLSLLIFGLSSILALACAGVSSSTGASATSILSKIQEQSGMSENYQLRTEIVILTSVAFCRSISLVKAFAASNTFDSLSITVLCTRAYNKFEDRKVFSVNPESMQFKGYESHQSLDLLDKTVPDSGKQQFLHFTRTVEGSIPEEEPNRCDTLTRQLMGLWNNEFALKN